MSNFHKYLLCLVSLLAPLGALADGETPSEFADGPTWYDYRDTSFSIDDNSKGTFYEPIVITTAEQLAQLAWLVNVEGQSCAGRIFNLGADIDLKKTVDGKRVQWIPIGYLADKPFDGMFLGLEHSMQKINWQADYSHTISGLYINVAYPYPDTATRNLGLFGCARSFIGYLRLTDSSITTTVYKRNPNTVSDALYHAANVGLLCGQATEVADDADHFTYQEILTHYFRAPSAIYDVAVEGTISVASPYDYAVGGICGAVANRGICHSTAKVTLSYADAFERGNERYSIMRLGGVCGSLAKADFQTRQAAIVDCAASIQVSNDGSMIQAGGGIVGQMDANTLVAACTSNGYLGVETKKGETDTGLGGICGMQNGNARIVGCTSALRIDGPANVGGITGAMSGTTYNTKDPLVDACMFSGVITSFNGNCLGGIVGSLNADGEASGLYINGSLFAGTFDASLSTNVAAIAASVPTPAENVGGCYYDAQLFQGNVVGTETRHASIRAVATADLTSGSIGAVTMLPADEGAEAGFTVARGYYPTVFCNTEWPGYAELNCNYNNSITFNQTYEYWKYANVDKANTVYQSGAWLCAVPVNIPKGDAAYDLVTKVVAPEKSTAWDDADRSISVTSRATYPNVDCIRISNDTAYAVNDGSFYATITMKAKTDDIVRNRPMPLGGTRQVAFNVTIDQVWDGTIATACAAGTGLKEDPYIIKNGAQLAYALLNNKEGEWYRQLCDIRLIEKRHRTAEFVYSGNEWNFWSHGWPNAAWNAQYDGDGHYVSGAYITTQGKGFFGDITSSGAVSNLGIVDANAHRDTGIFAARMNGRITNCIAQGTLGSLHTRDADCYLDYCGGFCSLVGPDNPDALIEDCIAAVYTSYFSFADYTPFVSLSDNNKGLVSNCLTVLPVTHLDAQLQPGEITMAGQPYLQNCYWLKGYEEQNTGQTLEEICNALGKRPRWKNNKGYLPTLKSFANTDMAKLLMVPFRTDIDYVYDTAEGASDNYLMGFGKQMLFEPGAASWTSDDERAFILEMDGDMGVIVPVRASFNPGEVANRPEYRTLSGVKYICGTLGKATHYIPVRTGRGNVNAGFSFVDENARQACLDAFDTSGDGILSLAELKAVTNEQTLSAFQTATARRIERFPEFRFFKAVTELTTQLNGLSRLEEVQLPYALETLGSDAFDGCTSLTEVTIPAKVDWVEPHPFYGSAIENVSIDPFNEYFTTRDGILFDNNNMLVAYPNGRKGEEAIVSGTISEISDGAFYNVDGLRRLYFETDDYLTVPYLCPDGIVSDNGELIDVYVSDATYGSVLMQSYYDDGSWDEYIDAGKLHCYYPLRIGNARAATLYIGFPTTLPSALKPYIVSRTDFDHTTAYLKRMPQEVPDRTPIVVFADEAGLYRLTPCETLAPWKMYDNELNGVGRDGMRVNQGDSDRGSILTLGRNSSGTLGFFYYLGDEIKPYRAYLTYNFVEEEGAKLFFSIDDNVATAIALTDADAAHAADPSSPSADPSSLRSGWFTLDGRRLNARPTAKGLYIHNGKATAVK